MRLVAVEETETENERNMDVDSKIAGQPSRNHSTVFSHNAVDISKSYSKKTCSHTQFWNQDNVKNLWKKMIEPCQYNMKYREKVDRENKTSIEKSNIYATRSMNETVLNITIISKNQYHQRKTIGGDSWKLTVYSNNISFVADILDNNDGTYKSFIEVPRSGTYNITVTLLHSVCESFMDPPEDFFRIGNDLFFTSLMKV